VKVGSVRDLLWNLAILFGWLSILPLGGVWHARKKFQALLKAPLTGEVEHMTHRWEQRVTRWTTVGLSMSRFSILCVVAWAVL
jgi:hypothetical protein